MTESTPATAPAPTQTGPENAAFALGRRLRHLRKQHGLTLAQASTVAGVAASQLSLIENGKREAKVSTLQKLGDHYGVSLDQLTGSAPPDRRAELEIALERYMNAPLAKQRALPQVRLGPRLPMDALEALVALHRAMERDAGERTATPEAARKANAGLRREMRQRNNYFAGLEDQAAELLSKVGYTRGPLSQHHIGALADHLNFSLHHVAHLPHSTRSVTDRKSRRIYLSRADDGHDNRAVLLQALGAHVLGHATPRDYEEFLRQRVETNYFAAAMLMPEPTVVDHLRQAKAERQMAVEDLRDAFAVSYETAAHRMTNLMTEHLDLTCHFMKVHESGIIHKAYANDDVTFPSDHTGAIEGQPCCRHWTSRVIFEVNDTFNAYNAYTDTPNGTYWCTARIQRQRDGDFSTCIGVPYVDAKWWRGRETRERSFSRCPDETCCRRPPADLADTWAGQAWPSVSSHMHLLAAMPPGAFPGVDETEVYEFLAQQADG